MLAWTNEERVAIITGVFGLVGILIGLLLQQRKVHNDNRNDHAKTMLDVKTLSATVSSIHADVRDTRADVRDIKATIRDHGQRLNVLEDPETEEKYV
ncbi:MAG: hypothetical protein EBR40_09105 [Proteobacteria bacterium]|nr:hypothetical protein [Pseudomonadota bacterium]